MAGCTHFFDNEVAGSVHGGGEGRTHRAEPSRAEPSRAAPRSPADAVAQVRDLIGVDLVGLGSDFDGSVTSDWDASQLAVVTQVLLERGSTDEEVAAVMGGNVLRVLGETLPR